ncbi:type II glyceraldehyde-3-phosphate dehydrogenase [Halorubrum sp. DTA98]|uniref:type II glyceraldehyde-3-phosphate dehydrogenase n=1 Tax=Halorubrum sp. DTA98 TaxID=3402163 RepID=UPI003AACBE68
MIRVGVNGYGTIGKRVADAVEAQPDMELVGIAKTRPNYEADAALRRGYSLYAAIADRAGDFTDAGIEIAGTLPDMLEEIDVVVDCCPSGVGAENRETYAEHDVRAVFQGGEGASVADASFNSRANFEASRDAEFVRVVSCNTTGLSRVIAPLQEQYGIEKVRATLVRRGGDPAQTGRGPINDVLPDPVTIPSHHGPDVNTVLPDVAVDTLGLTVPTTQMHTHSLNVTLESEPDTEEVRALLADQDRTFLIPEIAAIDGAGKLKEFARDIGRPRGDVWENCIWAESINVTGRDLYLFQNVHQEADVVPENVDAIRSMCTDLSPAESIARTNETLGIGLESRFDTDEGDWKPVTADD